MADTYTLLAQSGPTEKRREVEKKREEMRRAKAEKERKKREAERREAEARRKAEEGRRRKAAEAERRRRAAEAEKRRKAAEAKKRRKGVGARAQDYVRQAEEARRRAAGTTAGLVYGRWCQPNGHKIIMAPGVRRTQSGSGYISAAAVYRFSPGRFTIRYTDGLPTTVRFQIGAGGQSITRVWYNFGNWRKSTTPITYRRC